MRAWDILVQGSSLPSGTAWDHLNHQEGSGGGSVVVMGMAGNLEALGIEGSVLSEVPVASVLSEELELDVSLLPLSGVVSNIELLAEMEVPLISASVLEDVL